jgi:hypothetical protein
MNPPGNHVTDGYPFASAGENWKPPDNGEIWFDFSE